MSTASLSLEELGGERLSVAVDQSLGRRESSSSRITDTDAVNSSSPTKDDLSFTREDSQQEGYIEMGSTAESRRNSESGHAAMRAPSIETVLEESDFRRVSSPGIEVPANTPRESNIQETSFLRIPLGGGGYGDQDVAAPRMSTVSAQSIIVAPGILQEAETRRRAQTANGRTMGELVEEPDSEDPPVREREPEISSAPPPITKEPTQKQLQPQQTPPQQQQQQQAPPQRQSPPPQQQQQQQQAGHAAASTSSLPPPSMHHQSKSTSNIPQGKREVPMAGKSTSSLPADSRDKRHSAGADSAGSTGTRRISHFIDAVKTIQVKEKAEKVKHGISKWLGISADEDMQRWHAAIHNIPLNPDEEQAPAEDEFQHEDGRREARTTPGGMTPFTSVVKKAVLSKAKSLKRNNRRETSQPSLSPQAGPYDEVAHEQSYDQVQDDRDVKREDWFQGRGAAPAPAAAAAGGRGGNQDEWFGMNQGGFQDPSGGRAAGSAQRSLAQQQQAPQHQRQQPPPQQQQYQQQRHQQQQQQQQRGPGGDPQWFGFTPDNARQLPPPGAQQQRSRDGLGAGRALAAAHAGKGSGNEIRGVSPQQGPDPRRAIPAGEAPRRQQQPQAAVVARPKGKLDTGALKQMKSIREHRPFFTFYMSFCQIAVMIIAILVYNIAPIAFSNSQTSSSVDNKDGSITTVTKTVQANFWIGPSPAALVLLGAKFAPCMRKDSRVVDEVLNPQKAQEATFGCCRDQGLSGGNCFTGSQAECTGFKDWQAGVVCGGPQCCTDFNGNKSATYPNCERAAANATLEASCKCTITARPCCIGLVGKCEIQSKEYCDFMDGYWHDDKETCSQVNCLDSTCGLISFAHKSKPDQWYRIYLPLFIHMGVVQLFFVLLFQHSIAVDIERLAGWLRMFFIYALSGIGGYLLGAILAPYQVSAGGSPALYGLLGCLFVELFQSWQLLNAPWSEFFKLFFISLIALGLGLLPYIDNWAHVGGFVFGVLSSIVFLPYITFGKWDAARKRTLIIICLPAIAVLLAIGFSLLFTSKLNNCTWCKYFDCVNFVENFCEENSQDLL